MLAQNDPSACLRDRGVDVERGYGMPILPDLARAKQSENGLSELS
jgi:hypothetical protein